MGGQPALGALLRPFLRHWAAHDFLRSSVAKAAVHIVDADLVGYGCTAPAARLAVLLHLLRLFVDAGLKEQLVVVAGGRRPPFKRERGASVRDGGVATTYHALFACLKALEDADFQVIRSETECDWRIVHFQRAMQRRDCPAIVYSRDWDFASHMCPFIASLESVDGELTFQTLNLEEAARGLGLDGLGATAFPILGAIIPNSDWGTALRGVGTTTALDIMQSLQQLACTPQGSGKQPRSLTPELILKTALEQERVEVHESQTNKAAALQTLAQNLVIFGMGPVVKVGLDFDDNRFHISLQFSCSARIGRLRLDNALCKGVVSRMQRQLAEEFASVTPMQYINFRRGQVDPNGHELLDCGPPQGDASLLSFELEKVARLPPCVICGTEESSGWHADLMDWATANCHSCHQAIIHRLNSGACTTMADAVAKWESDRGRRALKYTGQPCSICEGAADWRGRLPAKVQEYCEAAGMDIGMLCEKCLRSIKRWGFLAHDAAEDLNKKLAAGATQLDPEAHKLQYSYWRVVKLTRQRGQRAAASHQGGAAGTSAVGQAGSGFSCVTGTGSRQ